MLALVVYSVKWHLSHTRRWNEQAIRTTFDGFYYGMSSSPLNGALRTESVSLRYVAVNSTASDYRLSPENVLVVLYKGPLAAHPTFHINGTYMIPARHTLTVEILAPAAYNNTWDVDGFVVFDSSAGYKIAFPRPTKPTADDKSVAFPKGASNGTLLSIFLGRRTTYAQLPTSAFAPKRYSGLNYASRRRQSFSN